MKHISLWSSPAFLLLSALTLEVGFAQTVSQSEHDRAQAAQDAHDKRHHNTAKTMGGTLLGERSLARWPAAAKER